VTNTSKYSYADVRERKKIKHHKGRSHIPMSERPFIAWDGEGEHPKDSQGRYLLFGCSTGEDIATPDDTRGLRASECFAFLIDVARRHPHAIHVAFAFNYDVTMMIASLPIKVREKVASGITVWWNQYRIENLSRKWFKLYDKRAGISITVFDIFTFFGCSALQAWREYLPGDTDLALVEAGKSGRDSFTYSDLPFLRSYMHRELNLYERLADRLRFLLLQLDISPRGWYGPGAVASAFLNLKGIKNHRTRELPQGVIQASQHAYFGGRFECMRTGLYRGPVYKNDIRSAYPHALRKLPSLTQGKWIHREFSGIHDGSSKSSKFLDSRRPGNIREFSLYRVSYRGSGNRHSLGYHQIISPFPYRDFRGLIHFPRQVDGWYWGVEVQTALKWASPGEILIHEAWEFIEDENCERPFAFITDLYTQRALWKAEGNPVQLACKLVMNSLYGKLAQRIGWNEETNEPPTWHQLEYAGFATAYCRSMVYDAMARDPDSIIAVETDGIFSTKPLSLPDDHKQLGDWEVERYEGIAYVQSGVYGLRNTDDTWTGQKMRGFSKGDFDMQDVLNSAKDLTPITAHTHRFAALKGYWGDKRLTTWLDNSHVLVWGGGGKRAHDPSLCRTCLRHPDRIRDGLHDCFIGSGGGFSEKHILPWRTDNRDLFIRQINHEINQRRYTKV
jgi:hypothetical protein